MEGTRDLLYLSLGMQEGKWHACEGTCGIQGTRRGIVVLPSIRPVLRVTPVSDTNGGIVQLHKHARARGSTESGHKALRINLRWNKQCLSHSYVCVTNGVSIQL